MGRLPRLPLHLGFSAFALIALVGFVPPEFRGCGDDTPVVPPPDLPRADGGGVCTVDTDCPPAGDCRDVRCVARTCVTVARMIDRDSDSYAPPPCGMDCNDSDPDVHPAAREVCNRIDDNCDGMVDEGAAPLDTRIDTATGDPMSMVVPWGDRFLVTTVSGGLFARLLGVDGAIGAFQEILRGRVIDQVEAAPAPDGRVLFVVRTDMGAFVTYVLAQPAADGSVEVLAPATDVALPMLATSIATTAHGTGFAIAVDGVDATGTPARYVYVVDALGSRMPFGVPHAPTMSPTPLAIASDGTSIAVTSDDATVRFFSDSGTEVGSQTLPGGFPDGSPLASGAGDVVAAYHDSFDLSIVRVRPTLLGTARPLSGGGVGDRVALAAVPAGVVVGRWGFSTATATIYSGDLTSFVRDAIDLTGSSPGVTRVSVAGIPRATSLLVARTTTSGAVASATLLVSCE